MDMKSQRELLRVSPACELPELAGLLARALAGAGPALKLAEVGTEICPSSIAVVIGTSGSSGLIKEVAFTSQSLLASARAANSYLGAANGSTWSLLLPTTHIAGINVILRSMEVGTLPVDLRNFHGEYPVVDFTSIVPTQLFRALNSDAILLRHLQKARAVLVGGAALSPALRKDAEAAGIRIIETYGMTETCGGCIYDGKPLAGVEFKVSEHGAIAIQGSVLANSYLNAPELFNLKDGWFTTNDLGEIVDGKLVVKGRSDDVIISGGENLSLIAIEATLSVRFPEIECAAFAVNDPQWGQALHVAVVGDVTETEISHYLEAALGGIAKPKGILFLDSLPLLGIGKIDRMTLTRMVDHE
jgi:O-succinylbenzoic acid--CoA ligase